MRFLSPRYRKHGLPGVDGGHASDLTAHLRLAPFSLVPPSSPHPGPLPAWEEAEGNITDGFYPYPDAYAREGSGESIRGTPNH